RSASHTESGRRRDGSGRRTDRQSDANDAAGHDANDPPGAIATELHTAPGQPTAELLGGPMSITALWALVCIVLGLIGPIIDEQVLMPALAWFVVAIAFNTLTIDYTFGRKL